MTFIGIGQDLAMLWIWLSALIFGGPPSQTPYAASLGTAPALASLSKGAAGDAAMRHCTYLFEGTLASPSNLLPHARVLVRLTSPHGTAEKISTADAQGRYSLQLDIDAVRREPVDWSMQTDSANGLEVELAGRRIVMDDDRFIIVHDGLDAVPAQTLHPPVHYTPSAPYEEAAVG